MASIDQLLQTPPAELVDELKTLRDQRADIEGKEAVLEQLLEILAAKGPDTAAEIAALGGTAAIGPLRNQIIQVLISRREEGEYLLVPQEVHKELLARGNRAVTLDNVRITMRRMVESKELELPNPKKALTFSLPGASRKCRRS
jgi:hypothetical protein